MLIKWKQNSTVQCVRGYDKKGKGEFRKLKNISIAFISLQLASCATQRTVPDYPTKKRNDVIVSLNNYRITSNLSPVTFSPELDQIAKRRAQHAWQYRLSKLSDGHSYFNRDVTDSRISGQWFGENLYSVPSDSLAENIIKAWHESHSHKLMMLRKTLFYCSAVEAFDKAMIVVALICNDLQDGTLIKF